MDLTVGFGGHARMFAEAVGATGTLVGLDIDPDSLDEARRALVESACRVQLINANFADVREALESIGIHRVDVLFADLGLNSSQIANAERGFSFQVDGPLDMRMGPDLQETAADLVNRLKAEHPEQEIHFLSPIVCMCATMYRIDLAHLCWSLENLAAGTPVNIVRVDDETARWSLVALERMLAVH